METDYFTAIDVFSATLWLLIILITGHAIRSANRDKLHYKYFLPNLYAKLFFSMAFTAFFLYNAGGGDTIAYFDGAVNLNNLFFKSPSMYFDEMLNTPDPLKIKSHYDMTTGYPPGWIYREPEAFFISKLMSILSFFTLKSYLAITFLMAFVSSLAAWRLFQLVRSFGIHNDRLLAIGTLLIPSVNFWCTGISKDTVVVGAAILVIYHFFSIFSREKKSTLWNYAMIVFFAFIILHVRPFILYTIAVPITYLIVTRVIKLMGGGTITLAFFRVMVVLGGIILIQGSIISQSEEEFLASNSFIKEASVIQIDFDQNKTYGDKRYDLGEIEFTPLGIIKVAPMAIIAGMYRPFPWEALSVALILNGIESAFFIYFTYLFFRRNFRKKVRIIKKSEILLFSVMLVFLIAFVTGLTSVLFGVLVRQRAILIPFLFLLLTLDLSKFEAKQKVLDEPESNNNPQKLGVPAIE